MRRILFGMLLASLLVSVFIGVVRVRSVSVTETIYIKADGNVDPPDSPILIDGDLYTLADNITSNASIGIVIERDNMILDGAGYALNSSGSMAVGIDLNGRSNVTITNISIIAHETGIFLNNSENNTIAGSRIIHLEPGVSYSPTGIYVNHSCFNIISDNVISDWIDGIMLRPFSDNNTIVRNHLVRNMLPLPVAQASDNRIFHNSFVDSGSPVSVSSLNFWDDGYPSGGNYWSDYTGIDLCSGPYQNETGSDGIGDKPYVIDVNNVDHYPLMKPYAGSHDIGLLASVSKTVVAQGFNMTVTADVKVINYGMQEETFNFTFQLIGTFSEQTITLASRNSTDLSFVWNTTDFAKGNYVILAHATPVSGETYTTDNTFTSLVYIGVPGDVDGSHTVNMLDLYKIALDFGAVIGQPNYISNYDVDGNGIINTLDLYIAAIHFGQTDP